MQNLCFLILRKKFEFETYFLLNDQSGSDRKNRTTEKFLKCFK